MSFVPARTKLYAEPLNTLNIEQIMDVICNFIYREGGYHEHLNFPAECDPGWLDEVLSRMSQGDYLLAKDYYLPEVETLFQKTIAFSGMTLHALADMFAKESVQEAFVQWASSCSTSERFQQSLEEGYSLIHLAENVDALPVALRAVADAITTEAGRHSQTTSWELDTKTQADLLTRIETLKESVSEGLAAPRIRSDALQTANALRDSLGKIHALASLQPGEDAGLQAIAKLLAREVNGPEPVRNTQAGLKR